MGYQKKDPAELKKLLEKEACAAYLVVLKQEYTLASETKVQNIGKNTLKPTTFVGIYRNDSCKVNDTGFTIRLPEIPAFIPFEAVEYYERVKDLSFLKSK